jgi:hypothetical protein
MPVIPMNIGIFRHLITTSRQLKQDSLSRKTGAKDNVSFFVDSVVQKAILCRSLPIRSGGVFSERIVENKHKSSIGV